MKEIEAFERELCEADRWVDETAKCLDGDRALAHEALRAVLQTVRDCLQFDDAVRLGDKLPALVRGMYFDRWDPSPPPVGGLTLEIFLTMVCERLTGLEPARAVEAVFQAARALLRETLDPLTRDWPGALTEFLDLGDAAPIAVQSPDPADLEKADEKMRAAMDRAEIDGVPQESYREVLEKAESIQPPVRSTFAGDVEALTEWIQPLVNEPGWPDADTAFAAVRVVLKVLRDRLDRDEAVRLAGQLPCALRGFYFEDWQPDREPAEEDLRQRVARQFDRAQPTQALKSVVNLLTRKLSGKALDEVKQRLPMRKVLSRGGRSRVSRKARR